METKGLTCKIPLELHSRITDEIQRTESTLGKFIEKIILEHYEREERNQMDTPSFSTPSTREPAPRSPSTTAGLTRRSLSAPFCFR